MTPKTLKLNYEFGSMYYEHAKGAEATVRLSCIERNQPPLEIKVSYYSSYLQEQPERHARAKNWHWLKEIEGLRLQMVWVRVYCSGGVEYYVVASGKEIGNVYIRDYFDPEPEKLKDMLAYIWGKVTQ